jgi:hypothetical protein
MEWWGSTPLVQLSTAGPLFFWFVFFGGTKKMNLPFRAKYANKKRPHLSCEALNKGKNQQ